MKKKTLWAHHLDAWGISGLSRKAYCEEHNLSYQMFFYYQSRQKSVESNSFREVNLDVVDSADKLEYHFPDGGCLVMPSSRAMILLNWLGSK